MSPFAWVVLACTALSSLFALLSTSLRSLRRVQLEEAFARDPGRLTRLDEQLPALRLACAFCRSLSNLVLAVAMVYLMDAPAHGLERTAWALAAAGALIAIFGVAIPSAWASHAGEKMLWSLYDVMMFCRYLLYPVVVVMQAFDKPVRRLSGVGDEEPVTQEAAKQEILQAASEGQAEGTVEPEEVRMIESVMEFGDRRAGEIMIPRTDIFALPASTTWENACLQVASSGHSRVPIYEGDLDNITGILYAKDLLQHVGKGRAPALHELQRKPFFVPQSKLLDDLLREFKARKVHIAVVLDEYGGTAGLVSIEDVLEEIVGEIADEYDHHETPLLRRLDDHSAEVDGRMYIDDINDALGMAIPEDKDYDTIAGYVFSELGYIPAVGEQLQAGGARITVLAADERRITRLKIEVPAQSPGSSP